MTIEQTGTVDIVNVDRDSGDLLLTVSDHLPWSEGEGQHLLLLQEKLNAYLGFIESGELVKRFPEASGRQIVINVVGKFPLSETAQAFFERAGTAIETAGFKLRFSLLRPN
ncbi:DUF6572 domain-containing protein [Trinickia sp. Y13]|uniref:DUF6572 domain-containing protein n=1 Tax=Trinickia sp. Y13 TaxID=2917807 RepID=UPI0024065269|nr:DUF6572 domain-containing protein [Trinickia sp. Y13]MDG0025359.1 hypothetical protein [Trinickia sp. Y13]